ncbi:phytoene desaturase family protein [Planctomyces sp. SH-PL14]|uniref:phytoene desaturase family protein n=1 Tax=Planctomyces sp. SH-PL14 TaxID=1632864 RepID=UPI0009463550|nr:NAD(P)/FAD-dependent oxidoreductase [Planctomyces sp. SH-PL14]
MRYHTLIIGAGMSGLAAGIRLAYYEKPVCILERHTTIGGLNSFYRLRGRNYDVGLHAVTNYAPPGTRTGPLAKLLKQLRLRWDDFSLKPQCGSAVVFPGRRLNFTNDFPAFVDEVAAVFPQQADRFRRLVETINAFDELDLSQEPVSARKVLQEHLSDPVLIDMLFCPLMFYGSAIPHDMDFSQFVIMFKSIFQQGFGRPLDGVRQILKVLTRHFKELGGELKLRHGVREIKVENGRAVGVILDDGREIEADNVLSSAGAAETVDLLPGTNRETVPRPAEGELSFNETIFVLDKQPADLGHRETIIFYNDSERFTYAVPDEPCDVRSLIVCSPNNFRYEEGPGSGDEGLGTAEAKPPLEDGIVRITALANPAYWFSLPDEEYARQKAAWGDRMVESALRFMPDFRPHVVDTDIFTPKTIKRFTGHARGAVYGAPRKILTGETPVENLFLCGTDQGFLGIIGSMLSGITIANNQLLRDPPA